MRDRLEELRKQAKEAELTTDNESKKTKQTGGNVAFKKQIIIFEKEPVILIFLVHAEGIKDEINELRNDIKKLSEQSTTTVLFTRRFSIIKKDSSNLIKNLKVRAESIHKQLDSLSKDAKQSEAEFGEDAVVSRIKRAQYSLLFQQYQMAMLEFNTVLTNKQEICKKFMQRQLEVIGKEVSEEELNNMVEHDKWYVFNENFLTDLKITKQHMSEIEFRHKELISLENQIKELQDLFVQISLLVQEQGDFLNNIERATLNTKEYTEKSKDKIKQAGKYIKQSLCRKLCCWCFTCCI
ncbi:syntaxin-19 [Pristis pectinata]|uniref:syntaxin-19 n=1 Tax=Pristis pectinata TaxID=685728 RepID=UPI00223D0974|nr:syntaxin-19 [Pristis pectinata]